MTQANRKNTIIGDVLVTMSAKVAAIALGLVTGIITARSLGPAGKGILAVAMLVPTFMQWFGTLGLNAANVYFIGTRPEQYPSLAGNSLRLALAVPAVHAALFWLIYPLTRDTLFKGVPPLDLAVSLGIGALQICLVQASSLLVGQRKYAAYNTAQVLQALTTMVLFALVLGAFGLGVTAALVAVSVSYGIAAGAAVRFSLRGIRGFPPGDLRLLGPTLKYGSIAFLGGASFVMLMRADMFLVNAWRNSRAEVGYYSVAVAFVEVLKGLPDALHLILFPRLSSKDRDRGAQLTAAVSRMSLAATLPALAVLLFIARPLILIAFGEAFLPALEPSRILMSGVLFLVLTNNVGTYLMGNGLVARHLSGTLAGLAVMLVLDWLWIPRFGIVGAAWASFIGYGSMAAVHLRFFLGHSGLRVGDALLLKGSDVRELAEVIAAFRSAEKARKT